MAKPGGPVARARFDREFLESLEENPAETLRDHGIKPTPEMVDAIREMDFGPLYRLAAEFEKPLEPMMTVGARAELDEVGLVFP